MAIKKQQQQEEEQRTLKIGEYNIKKLKEMILQDEVTREKKKQAALSYQRALDQQLGVTRTRQIHALTKTMSDEEQLYNSALIRKYGVE